VIYQNKCLNLFCLHENDILAHPFFGDLHDPTDEPTIDPLVEEHHDANHSIEMWKCE
jgi:hypothetical protein